MLPDCDVACSVMTGVSVWLQCCRGEAQTVTQLAGKAGVSHWLGGAKALMPLSVPFLLALKAIKVKGMQCCSVSA